MTRIVTVGDDFTLPAPVKVADGNLPARLGQTALNATYVLVRKHDGTPVTGKVLVATLTADETDIDNIAVYNSIDEVGS